MKRANQMRPFTLAYPFAPLALALVGFSGLSHQAYAQFPMQNMGLNRLGIGYSFLASGQNITQQKTPSQQLAHHLLVGYTPVPYVGLVLGMGVADFQTEPTATTGAFRGGFGFSPMAGLRLATPAWVQNMLRVTAGFSAQYLQSDDVNGLSYNAFILDPDLGLQLSPLGFLNIQVGGRFHLVDGTIEPPHGAKSSAFSNGTTARGYLGATLKTPSEGAFFSIDLDLSPDADANWSHGPVESTIRITMGTVLGWRSREPKVSPNNPYFPNYRELKDRQEQMSDQLQSD
jgi:hypothetical protein